MQTQTYKFIEKARAMMLLSRLELAIQELHQALSLDPDNLEALSLITACYLDMHQNEEAARYTARMLELAPNYAPPIIFRLST
ncbi:MAG: hypothetical protein HC880_13160 [Bacteroidia bacterium]|nr:hypothetical protein [Bacteroidia bacterium]